MNYIISTSVLTQLSSFIDIIIWGIFIIFLIVGGGGFYLIKVKKLSISAAKPEIIDYSKVKKEDSIEYVKFDDIISAESCEIGNSKKGVIVTDGGSRFVAGITVEGFDYDSASRAEQSQCINAMQSFINIINGPITFRQTTKKVDHSKKISECMKVKNDYIMQLAEAAAEYEDTLVAAKNYIDDNEAFESFDNTLSGLQKKISVLEMKRDETERMLEFLNMQTNYGETDRQQSYIFEWKFSKLDLAVELNQEEIYKKAISELHTIGNNMISSLSGTNANARRMTANELMDAFRRHNQPLSGEEYAFEEVYETEVDTLYITSNSYEEKIKEIEAEQELKELIEKAAKEKGAGLYLSNAN